MLVKYIFHSDLTSFLQNLDTVFVSTDAPDQEFQEFKKHLPGFQVVKFIPNKETLQDHKDGGIAIIDQIICSHAR